MKKKLISVVLIVCLILAVCACKGNEEFSFQYDSTNLAVDKNEEPVTITYLTIGDKPTNGTTDEVVERINKILLKKVNAKLDIYYVGWDDYLDVYNRVLSNGLVDIDLVGTATDWLDAWPNVVNGNFLPMSREMLSTFCPMTYANVSDAQWAKCSYDGDIYFLPENEYTQWTNHGFVYRGDIADEAGIGEIKNWDELTLYLEYVADNRRDIIPWDADGSCKITGLGYLTSVTKYNPIYEISTYGIWGANDGKVSEIYSPYYEGQEFIDFAKLMKKWDDMGVWRKPFEGTRDTNAEFKDGSTALDQHHTQNFYTAVKPSMEVSQPMADARFYWFGKESGNVTRTSILHGAMAVSSRSKNPEKALMVYDILRNDEECYRLICYGIEGRQYVVTQGGKMEKPSGYNSQRDSFLTNFWWGRRDANELIDSSFSWNDYYALIDQYERVAVDYPWDGYNFAKISSDERTKKIIAIFDKYITDISYANYDVTPEEEVALFREELRNAGFEEVTKEIQKAVDLY